MRGKMYLVLLVLGVFFTLGIAASSSLLSGRDDTQDKIGVVTDSRWTYAGGWPQTDYLAILRETTSALEYLGYSYEIVNEKTKDEQLKGFNLLISIAGTQPEKIINYSKGTGKTVLVLYDLTPELKKYLGVTGGRYILGNDTLASDFWADPLTKRVTGRYGSLHLWGAYSYHFRPETRILLKNTAGLPVLAEHTGPEGRYVMFLTRALNWNACNYNLIENVVQRSTSLARVGGTPYGMDVPIMLRLDDFSTWWPHWRAYTNLTPKLTFGAIMAEATPESVKAVTDTGASIAPHGFGHKDLSLMTAAEQKADLQRATTFYRYYTGNKPSGYIPPFNRINDATTKTASALGLNWVTSYHGMADIPRFQYTDSPNRVWVLGNRPEPISDRTLLDRALAEAAEQQKPLLLVEHPNQVVEAGTLEQSLAGVQYLINQVQSREGFYLTVIEDYFKHLAEQRQVSVRGSDLIVNAEVGPGLTLAYPGCSSEKMVQVNGVVLMYYRSGRTVLPKLSPGQYRLQFGRRLPLLVPPTPGIIVKTACYKPKQTAVEISLEAGRPTSTNITIENLSAGLYSVKVGHDTIDSEQKATVAKNGRLTVPLHFTDSLSIRIDIKKLN